MRERCREIITTNSQFYARAKSDFYTSPRIGQHYEKGKESRLWYFLWMTKVKNPAWAGFSI